MAVGFPKLVTDLPEADISFEGIKGWIAQREGHQIVFFEMEPLRQVHEMLRERFVIFGSGGYAHWLNA